MGNYNLSRKISKNSKNGKTYYKYVNNNREVKKSKEHSGLKILMFKGLQAQDKEFINSLVDKKNYENWSFIDKEEIRKSTTLKSNFGILKLLEGEISQALKDGKNVIINNDITDSEEKMLRRSFKGYVDFDVRKVKPRTKVKKSNKKTPTTQYQFSVELTKALILNYNISSAQKIAQRAKNIKDLIDKIPVKDRIKIKDRMKKK